MCGDDDEQARKCKVSLKGLIDEKKQQRGQKEDESDDERSRHDV